MGYKIPPGQNNNIPRRFMSEFQGLNYSPPGIVRTQIDLRESIERAREVFANHGVKIRNGNTLDRLFINASSRPRRKGATDLIAEADAHFATVLASLIIAFADEVGIKDSLKKIAGSDVATSSRRQSTGKDVIWELTVLSNLRISGISSRIAEPDLVADFGFGDYGFACKKIYSENSVEKAIKKGVDQIERAKIRGIVALNLDELILPEGRTLYASTQDFLRHTLQDYAEKFIDRHSATLERFAEIEACDGYFIYMSAPGFLLDKGHLQPLAVTTMYCPKNDQSDQLKRLDSLGRHLGRAEGLAEWVRKVGGRAVNW